MTSSAKSSSVLPVLLIVVAIGTLFAITYMKAPEFSISTYSSTLVMTAVNTEVLVEYSYTDSTCASSGSSTHCVGQVFPYTTTETWSAEIATIVPIYSTSTTHIPFASSGMIGTIALLLGLALLLAGVSLLAKKVRRIF